MILVCQYTCAFLLIVVRNSWNNNIILVIAMDRKENPVESGYNSCAGINIYIYPQFNKCLQSTTQLLATGASVVRTIISNNGNPDTGRSDGLCAGARLTN